MAARRTAGGIVTLLIASVLIFASVNVLPGDVAHVLLQQHATPEAVARISVELHLDDPLATRYARWLGGMLSGNLGQSTVGVATNAADPSVSHIIDQELVRSIALALITMLLLVPLSLGLGAVSAIRAGKAVDHVFSMGTLIFGSMPEFLVGTIFIVIFFSWLGWLPPISSLPPGTALLDDPKILILPVLTLLAVSTAYTARQIRANMIETLEQDYVTMARLNGYQERRVVWRYAFRNALAPSAQALGQTLQYLLGGIIVVESVFGFPGIGSQLVLAVGARDIQLVSVIAFTLAAAFIAINIVVDIIVVMLVPKLRTEAR
jgi:peptide/nickel transport system permease protein